MVAGSLCGVQLCVRVLLNRGPPSLLNKKNHSPCAFYRTVRIFPILCFPLLFLKDFKGQINSQISLCNKRMNLDNILIKKQWKK